MSYNTTIGKIGENKARRYLIRHGYKILHTNYRVKGGEIDIIAEKNGCTCFVEVKTRTNTDFGAPAEAVSYYKRQNLLKAAKIYIFRGGVDIECRFDVIEVFYNAHRIFFNTKINHMKNVMD